MLAGPLRSQRVRGRVGGAFAIRLAWVLRGAFLAGLLVAMPAVAMAEAPASARTRITRDGVADKIDVERLPDGRYVYHVQADDGTKLSLSPEEFSAWLLAPPPSSRLLDRLLNISSPIGMAWVALGLLGQLLFTGRMLVQWITSERLGRSTIPNSFWWLSLAGSLMLVVYFAWRRDVVGVLGQSTGCFIYLRNLRLIYRA